MTWNINEQNIQIETDEERKIAIVYKIGILKKKHVKKLAIEIFDTASVTKYSIKSSTNTQHTLRFNSIDQEHWLN